MSSLRIYIHSILDSGVDSFHVHGVYGSQLHINELGDNSRIIMTTDGDDSIKEIYYVKDFKGAMWLHRERLPAMISPKKGIVVYAEDGVTKKIEDLNIDEIDKMVLCLRLEYDAGQEYYHSYHGQNVIDMNEL